ncbi:MAG: hypothetical protein KF718_24800 [Polyangiaceae bacterium]|nr:hypothetical protein [Polyangiaceae bacterium]
MSDPAQILLVLPDALLRQRVRRALSRVHCELIELDSPDEFIKTLNGGRFKLVIASAQLGRESCLQVLAKVRQAGDGTPFLVLGNNSGSSFRVFVSDGEGVVLSSRVLDSDNLGRLADSYVAQGRAKSR